MTNFQFDHIEILLRCASRNCQLKEFSGRKAKFILDLIQAQALEYTEIDGEQYLNVTLKGAKAFEEAVKTFSIVVNGK